jgi:hypothetical protein
MALSHVHEDGGAGRLPNGLEPAGEVAYMLDRQLADYGDKRRVE